MEVRQKPNKHSVNSMRTEVFQSTLASDLRIADNFSGYPVYDQSKPNHPAASSRADPWSQLTVMLGAIGVSEITVRGSRNSLNFRVGKEETRVDSLEIALCVANEKP